MEELKSPKNGTVRPEFIGFDKDFVRLCKKHNMPVTMFIHITEDQRIIWGGHGGLVAHIQSLLVTLSKFHGAFN